MLELEVSAAARTTKKERGLSNLAWIQNVRLRLCSGGGVFLPSALRRFRHPSLLEGVGRDADVAHLTVGELGFDALEIRKEAALGDGRDVRPDAANLLGFAAAPDDAALHRPFSCQFTKSSHIKSCS